ncbi:hypothetical protein [Bradyrhizobium australiense]|uniref:hypothetical protein n=1 Tax=Bradyrhizobium australiense TaxID=2721161 RepID=UPI001F480C19|nr:hypothetical protein [Bradyrhizobium australiense]
MIGKLRDASLRQRLVRQFCKLLAQIGSDMGQSIPLAFVRTGPIRRPPIALLSERVNEADILCGHFEATRGRVAAMEESDARPPHTTEFSFKRERPDLIGFTGKTAGRTQCGILMHSSLAVTTEGLPLGLVAIKFWTGGDDAEAQDQSGRDSDRAEGEHPLAGEFTAIVPTFPLPLDDSFILDRESDIYELFCLAEEIGTHSCCEPVLIGLPGTAIIRLPTKWTRLRSKAYIGSGSRTRKAIRMKRLSKFVSASFEFCRRSTSRRNIPHSL